MKHNMVAVVENLAITNAGGSVFLTAFGGWSVVNSQ